MKRKKCFYNITIQLLVFSVFMTGCSVEQAEDGFQEEVKELLENKFKDIGALMVGVIKGDKQYTFIQGTKNKNTNDPPDENSIYGLGSITKTFTGIILAQMVIDGTVKFADEIQTYLPVAQVTIPLYNGLNLTLWHLATHTSGLSMNFSDNYPLPDGTPENDPFALMTEEHVYDYLSNYALLYSEPGSKYEYSNFGFGFLGHVISKIKNTSFENLLYTVILNELKMSRTSITLSEEQLENVAQGYDNNYDEADFDGINHVLLGAGSMKSTLNDMMIYLKANMGILTTRLNAAMELAQQNHFNDYVGLGWQKMTLSDGQIITQFGGAVIGYRTFIGFNKDYSTGVVLLYNIGSGEIYKVATQILEIARKYL